MNGKDVKVYIEGEGAPMVLLHGWGLDHTFMLPVFEYYKKTYRVCSFDLPGFKENANIDKALTIEDYVNLLEEIIFIYHLENPIIIAHSFGARIAFAYASKNPCSFLLLTGAAGIQKPRNLKYYIKIYTYKILKKLHISTRMGSTDFQNANDFMKKTLVNAIHYDSSKDIINIDCPILLIWGEKDEETPLWMAYTIKKLNTNVSLVILNEEDHFAYYHQMALFLKICDKALVREE